MVFYRRTSDIKQSLSRDFDTLHRPQAKTPLSGIYRCNGCKAEIVSVEGKPFPAAHTGRTDGHEISWRLVAVPGTYRLNPPAEPEL